MKELDKIPKRNIVLITNAIEGLPDNPRPHGCKKLKASKEELWRIRIGDYRVVYMIDDIIHIIDIRKIGHRRDIYQ